MFLNAVTYIRALIGIVCLGVSSILAASLVIIVTLITGDHSKCNVFIPLWARFCCWVVGAKLELKGAEKIPLGGCLFIFNHTSFYDIFAMTALLPGFRYGAKIELFKIPIFGTGMRLAGVLPIARNRREEVFKVYQEAEKRIAAGERFALAPEGTRQNQEVLAPFKSGPFVFAINAKAPIVPVVIKGALAVMSKDSLLPNRGAWSRTITVEVLDPISTSEYTVEDRPILQQKAYDVMVKYF